MTGTTTEPALAATVEHRSAAGACRPHHGVEKREIHARRRRLVTIQRRARNASSSWENRSGGGARSC
jgi:hypothetical protein